MSGTVVQTRSPLGRLDICCVAAAMVALPLSSRGMSGVTEPRARLFNVHWRPEKPALPLLKLPYGHTLREESNGPLHFYWAGCEAEWVGARALFVCMGAVWQQDRSVSSGVRKYTDTLDWPSVCGGKMCTQWIKFGSKTVEVTVWQHCRCIETVDKDKECPLSLQGHTFEQCRHHNFK